MKSSRLLLLLEERIRSAAHVLETLTSMTNTTLSDWRGVIGEKIERQQSLEQQIESLEEELELERRIKSELEDRYALTQDVEGIQNRISEIEGKLTKKFEELPFRIRPTRAKSPKQEVTIQCPECASDVKVQVRPRSGLKKLFKCDSCDAYSEISYSWPAPQNLIQVL